MYYFSTRSLVDAGGEGEQENIRLAPQFGNAGSATDAASKANCVLI